MCKTIDSPWLTHNQAREYLQMGDTALRRKLDSGEIPSYRRGNTRFVHTSDLDSYMRSLPSGAKVPAILRTAGDSTTTTTAGAA